MADLSVTVQNLKTFKELDKSQFRRFYLGYPYCLEKAGSLLLEVENIKAVIREIKALGKESHMVTPPIMQRADFNKIEKVITEAAAAGLDGIEINDVGMFAFAKKWPSLKITAGYFTNIYHPEAALEYIKEGATTVIPNSELMFGELKEIADRVGSPESGVGSGRVDVELAVYGNLPLGFAYDCFLKRMDSQGQCRQQCSKPYILANDEMAMASIGRANITAADFCLIEQIDEVKSIGASLWRLEMYRDSAEKINIVARAFNYCADGEDASSFIGGIKELTEMGLCNGWFFGESGHKYVNKIQKSKFKNQNDKEKLKIK